MRWLNTVLLLPMLVHSTGFWDIIMREIMGWDTKEDNNDYHEWWATMTQDYTALNPPQDYDPFPILRGENPENAYTYNPAKDCRFVNQEQKDLEPGRYHLWSVFPNTELKTMNILMKIETKCNGIDVLLVKESSNEEHESTVFILPNGNDNVLGFTNVGTTLRQLHRFKDRKTFFRVKLIFRRESREFKTLRYDEHLSVYLYLPEIDRNGNRCEYKIREMTRNYTISTSSPIKFPQEYCGVHCEYLNNF